MARSRTSEPTSAPARPRSRASRAYAVIFAIVVVLALALTGAWFYLAHELDRRVASALDAAAGGGTTIGCANRDVFGYPFRLGLSCDSVSVEAPANGIRMTGGTLRTAAQIYDPSRVVAELSSPVAIEAPGIPPLDLGWSLAQASTSLWSEGLERVSVVLDKPVVALRGQAGQGEPLARSDHLEAHARRNGAALDLAFDDRGVVARLPGLADLPPFDVAADLTVDGAAGWLRTGIPGGQLGPALRGEAGTIRGLRLALPSGGAADLSGPFRVDDEGRISGDFRLAIENPQAIAGLVGALVPDAANLAGTIAGGLGFAGRQENGRTVIDVQVRDGKARLGFIPLGRLPRI